MNQITQTEDATARKPRLALMGEFSAGKSTLSNLLLGADPLPVRVTATRLPPVWISYGDNTAERELLNGNVLPLDLDRLEEVPLEDTRLIRLYLESEILRLCDLIDMPGISDPNMEADVWRAVIGEADHVLWCTHATQAWRQSEMAVWESLPEHLRDKSLLLLTRFDKILSERDRERVLTRVRRETEGLFADVFPVALIEAIEAGENREAWEKSGADAFVMCLIDMLTGRGCSARAPEKDETAATGTDTAGAEPLVLPDPEVLAQKKSSGVRVMPARVRMKSGGQKRPRARPQESSDALRASALMDMPGNA